MCSRPNYKILNQKVIKILLFQAFAQVKVTISKTVLCCMKNIMRIKVAVKKLTARMPFAARDRMETKQYLHLMCLAHMK